MPRLAVIILAGGFATRLRPLSYTRPKALLKILDKPLIDYILESVAKLGPDVIILSLRYLADRIVQHVESRWLHMRDHIYFLIEDKPLGDAGPIVYASRSLDLRDYTLLVLNSDIFSNINLEDVVLTHRRRGALATIVLTRLKGDLSRFGVAMLDPDYRVVSFVEKPSGLAGEGLINAGVYVFEPEVLKYLPDNLDKPLKISLDLLPRLVQDGMLYAYVHEGFWFDIGTPEDYLRANYAALEYLCRDQQCARGDVEGVVHPPAYIAETAHIAKDAEIGPYTVITSGCRVLQGARVKRSVLLDRTIVDKCAYVDGAILGENVYIGKWARVESGTVIGDYAYVADEVYIAKNVRIGPHREVTEHVRRDGEIIL